MKTYSVVRHYFNCEELDKTIIKEGLTLAEAQKHCQDPETSSQTATNDWAIAHTAKYGDWFDGYREER